MTDMLTAALEYAEQGWPVFPCRANKQPYIEAFYAEATTNQRQIEDWWERWPTANIGFVPGNINMMVLDFDPGSSMEELENNVGTIPPTKLTASTPRHGRHLYFALGDGELVPPSASKLAPAVDVRSFHSYVLLPPSRTIDGSYRWEADAKEGRAKPAFRTDEIVRLSNSHREKHEDRDTWIIDPDLEENIALCVNWLATDAKPAIEGQGGDHTAFATAAMCKSYGISEETALELLLEHWNPRCAPPWSYDEVDHLRDKVTNAYEYNTSEPGNMTPAFRSAKQAMAFKPSVQETVDGGRHWKAGKFRVYDRIAMSNMPPMQWLIDGMLPENSYAMMYAPPGAYKTFAALDISLSLATGFQSHPVHEGVRQRGDVLYVAGEGVSGLSKRVAGWEALHNDGELVDGFYLSDPVPSVADDIEGYVQLMLDICPLGYKLVVLDTIGRALQGVDENKMENATAFTGMVEYLIRYLDCTVLALHHTGYDQKSKDRPRGSSAFRGDADVMFLLDDTSQPYTSELRMTKMKDAPEWKPGTRYIRFQEHRFDMEETTLVAMPVEKAPPKPKKQQAANGISTGVTADPAYIPILEGMKELFQNYPNKDWSDRGLADALASRDAIEVGSEQLRTRLKAIREDKTQALRKHYDGVKLRWNSRAVS